MSTIGHRGVLKFLKNGFMVNYIVGKNSLMCKMEEQLSQQISMLFHMKTSILKLSVERMVVHLAAFWLMRAIKVSIGII